MKRTGDLKLIQELNRSIILDTIRKYGPISRSEVAKRNELSPTTVTAAVSDLIKEGYVYESGTGSSSGGRKPILIQFSPDNHYLIGVSISYSKIIIADLNLEAKINVKETYPMNGYSGTSLINYLMELLGNFLKEREDHRTCIGISIITQGIVNKNKGIIYNNPHLQLNEVYLKDMAEREFALPVWLDNDTNAYVLAEKQFGDFQDIENMIYVTIGDGTGAGIIVNNSLSRGKSGGGGEFGHTSINMTGKPCECGNKGCIEKYVSWPAIYERLAEELQNGSPSSLTDFVNKDTVYISPKQFVNAVNVEDPLAIKIMDETISCLAVGIVNLVHLFNPEVIILGGEITNKNKRLISKLKESVKEKTLITSYKDVRITTTSLGEEFEMLGAASVLLQDKFQFKLTDN